MKKKFSLVAAIALLLANILPIANTFATAVAGASFEYNYTGGCAEVNIGGADVVENLEPCVYDRDNPAGTINTTFDYTYDGTVAVELQTLFTKRLTSVIINGIEYNTDANFPTTPAQILEAISDQHIHYRLTVPHSATGYTISTTAVENTGEYMTVGNFLWSYVDTTVMDNYVGHGKLELVNVKYKGVNYTQAELNALNKGYAWWHENPVDVEGGAMLPYGAEVTVKLMPDEGYQLTSFTLNGYPFEVQDEIGTYKFTVPRGNFHLGAHFTKVNDAVKADNADAIVSGSISLGGSEFDNGTVRLEVKNAEGLEPADIENLESNAEGYELKTVLDISLFNTIYKASADATWDTQLDELDHEATITLQLDPSVDGNDVIIVHEKHDGTYEVIPTTYDPVNHTITFKTSSFSNYAIATRTIASPNTGFMTKANGGATEEIDTTLAILSSLAIWGLLAFVAKKGF